MTKVNIEDVSEVFLLSDEEWVQAKKIPSVPVEQPRWWWLRSCGANSDFVCCVDSDGGIHGHFCIYYTWHNVRPAFRIASLAYHDFQPGDKILVGKKTVCTVITEEIALADNILSDHRFDPDNNDWETSEIKTFINSGEFLAML